MTTGLVKALCLTLLENRLRPSYTQSFPHVLGNNAHVNFTLNCIASQYNDTTVPKNRLVIGNRATPVWLIYTTEVETKLKVFIYSNYIGKNIKLTLIVATTEKLPLFFLLNKLKLTKGCPYHRQAAHSGHLQLFSLIEPLGVFVAITYFEH